MMTDIKELQKNIALLYPKRDRGDLTEKAFQREVADQTVALYRAIIGERLAKGETIKCDHHTIWTHFRVMQSILREPAQQAVSLFLTDRRLFRLKSTVMPKEPPTGDHRDKTSVDAVSIGQIVGLKKRLQIRTGEILLGAAFCGFAVLFHSFLAITGPFLLGLGVLGILHGLLLPSRWIEVKTADGSPTSDPILIYALRKKTGKELVRRLREKLRHS